jgi:cobalt/nickel transport system permease protein
MPFVSYWVFKLIRGNAVSGARPSVAAFLSGYVGLSVAAIVTGFEFGIQPLIASGADGRPLYAPYPLSVALPAMALEHMLLFSVVEGVVTVLLFKYFAKHESDLVNALKVKEA